MASEAQPAPLAAAVPPAPTKKFPILAAVVVGGAVLGGLVASFVIAPRVIARQNPQAAGTNGAVQSTAKKARAEGDSVLREGRVVSLDNIIVNPAGSQGSRFLMTSVAFEVEGAEAEKALRAREVEVRDRVTSILEAQTMAALTSPGARDSLKRRIGDAVSPMLGPDVKLHVYLPQFVIQ
jgi:flagellar FliL protein